MNKIIQKKLNKIVKDIKAIKIQGATNVALATLEGIKLVANDYKGDDTRDIVKDAGERLSLARENEPLARNAVKYVLDTIPSNSTDANVIIKACDKYGEIIRAAKKEIVKYGVEALKNEEVVLTHCHSSTSTSILIEVDRNRKEGGSSFRVVSTETRPLYQGRKTARELFQAGVDVTQIVDSANASFIIDDTYLPVGAVIVGCDELLKDGSFINKVGTYTIALAAKEGKDEFYVATTLLKLDPNRDPRNTTIEQRESSEIWKDAPKGLKIINPAFEQINSSYVSRYITEAGLLKSKDLLSEAKKYYPWIF